MAQMDPRFITDAAAQPNYLATMVGAQEAAQGQINAQRQNALARVYQEQGPGIMAGDPNALNALARYDPVAAVGVQDTRQGMEADRERLTIARAEGARLAAEHAAAMDASTKAQKIEESRNGLLLASAAWKAGDQAELDRIVTSHGMEPFPLADFPVVASMIEGTIDAMTSADALANPQSDYKVAGDKLIEITPDGPKDTGLGGRSQTSKTVYDPTTGNPVYSEGPQVGSLTNANITDGQKAAMSLESALGALDNLQATYLAGGGGAVLPGQQKDALAGARRDLQLQMKELYNLGVLNGPDLELMNQMLVDPTSVGNAALNMVGIADLDKRMDANIAQVRDQLIRMAAPKMRALGLAVPDSATPPPQPGPQAASAPYQEPATPDFSAMSDAELQAWIDANK